MSLTKHKTRDPLVYTSPDSPTGWKARVMVELEWDCFPPGDDGPHASEVVQSVYETAESLLRHLP